MSEYGVESIPHIPDDGDSSLWASFGVRGQPAWALIRVDGTVEVGFGAIPDEILADAVA